MIIAEKLVVHAKLFTNMTFVVFLVEMFVEGREVVKTLGGTELTQWVALGVALPSSPVFSAAAALGVGDEVAVFVVFFELVGCEPRETADEIAFVFNAELAQGEGMCCCKVMVQALDCGTAVVIIITVVIITAAAVVTVIHIDSIVGVAVITASDVTTQAEQWHDLTMIIRHREEHPHVVVVYEIGSEVVSPPLVLIEGLVLIDGRVEVGVDNDSFVGGLANGAAVVAE